MNGTMARSSLAIAFNGFEKFLRFLRRQCRVWFVQDQDFGPAVERFQDFNGLFFPFGKLPDFGSQIHFKAILAAAVPGPALRLSSH